MSFVVARSSAATDAVATRARAVILEMKSMLKIMHSATIRLFVAFGATAYRTCVTK